MEEAGNPRAELDAYVLGDGGTVAGRDGGLSGGEVDGVGLRAGDRGGLVGARAVPGAAARGDRGGADWAAAVLAHAATRSGGGRGARRGGGALAGSGLGRGVPGAHRDVDRLGPGAGDRERESDQGGQEPGAEDQSEGGGEAAGRASARVAPADPRSA